MLSSPATRTPFHLLIQHRNAIQRRLHTPSRLLLTTTTELSRYLPIHDSININRRVISKPQLLPTGPDVVLRQGPRADVR